MNQNASSGIAMIIVWILSIVVWISVGIATFNWIDVDSFWSAIKWLIVWHLITTVAHFIFMGIIMWISEQVK